MAQKYEVTPKVRRMNHFAAFLARWNVGPGWKLTTTGRKSGERREVMVTPITVDGTEYLVAPYGPVSWVLNLRASDRATLTRGNTTSRVKAIEVHAEEAGKVLTQYCYQLQKRVKDYFDVAPNATIADFTAVADAHPVFRIEHPM